MRTILFILFTYFIKCCNAQDAVLTSGYIEARFPNWYSMPLNCTNRPSYGDDSIKIILNWEIKEMEKLIAYEISIHKDSIYNYYDFSLEEQSNLDSLLNQWQSKREILAAAYLYSNNGSGRGISQLCFYRDYTKIYLLMLLNIYP